MKVLLVHGRSQGGKDPVKLRDEWLSSLDKGFRASGLAPPPIEAELPFYGDLLDEYVRQFDLPADPAIVPNGNPAFEEFQEFRLNVAVEMQNRAGITDAQVLAEANVTSEEKGIQNWAWVQAVVRLLDRNAIGVSQTTIEVFLRDVFLYTRRPVVQNAIDRIVSKHLSDNVALVIGHSLGSVVAYNVLKSRSSRALPLVTLGSPLAIRAIRRSLLPILNPCAKSSWDIAFDPRDIVALYPLDKNNFGVEPEVTNFPSVNNWTDNRHGVVGYLDDANVARTIDALLSHRVADQHTGRTS
jgi:hypothetical protein